MKHELTDREREKVEKLIKEATPSTLKYLKSYLYRRSNGSQSELLNDAMQEAKIRAFSRFYSYDPEKEFDRWFFRIALNCLINLLGASNKDNEHLTSINSLMEESWGEGWVEDHRSGSQAMNPEELMMLGEEGQAALQIIKALPESLRVPLWMAEVEGIDYEVIAQKLNIAVPALRVRLCRAKKKAQELAATYAGTHKG